MVLSNQDAAYKVETLTLENSLVVYPRYTDALLERFPHLRIVGKRVADGYLTSLLLAKKMTGTSLPDVCYLELNNRKQGWIEVRTEESILITNNGGKDRLLYYPDLLSQLSTERDWNLTLSFVLIYSSVQIAKEV